MSKKPLAVFITDTHLSEKTIEVNFQVWEQAFTLCDSIGVSEIWHGGDVFTSRKGQSEIVLNAFKSILDIAAERQISITAIAGNHDKQSYVAESSFLDAFHGQPNFQCFSPYNYIKHETGIIIHFLPYFDESLCYLDYLSAIKCPLNVKNILITHVGIDGILNNSDSKVENGLKKDLFAKFDLVLIGHYHNRQILDNIVYTGSTHQANFGEDMHKGATIVYDDASYEFIQFEFPQFNTIEIDVKELNRDLLKQVKQKDENVNVRFKIKGELESKQNEILMELQQINGVKTEVVKESFKPLDVIQSESLQFSSNDILVLFDEWAKDRQIENVNFGKELLKKNV